MQTLGDMAVLTLNRSLGSHRQTTDPNASHASQGSNELWRNDVMQSVQGADAQIEGVRLGSDLACE